MKLKDLKNEIKVLDIAGLIAKAKALKIEINDLVLDKNINKIKDLKSINKKRKEMARILTAMNVKKMIAGIESKVTEVTKDSKAEKTESSSAEASADRKVKKGAKK